MKPLHIVHTPVRSYPHIGGVELHVHNLAHGLVDAGHSVDVVAAAPPQTHPGSSQTKYTKILLPWFFKITNTEITFGLPLHLMKAQYDIVHSHIPTPWTSDWSMLIAKLKKKKAVITIHNDMKKDGVAGVITKIYVNTAMRLALRLADQIVVVNKDWEKSFSFTKHVLIKYREKIKYIPNAVDLKLFASTAPRKKQHILCVSVLDKYHDFKGIPYLLEAFSSVLQKYPDAILQIVGEGELKNAYQRKAKKLAISHATQFIGKVNQAELVKYYSQATVFVLPSTDTEGFGLVLLESLACRTPVITTPVAGVVQDIQETACGVVVPVKNKAAIATEIIKYFEHPELVEQHGQHGLKMVEQRYNWQLVTEETLKLYQSL